jgi:aryl-alcohol dehydrogenase-like predicted oxidoreductase
MALVEELAAVADEAGIRLVDLAHAFVLAHPAVDAAILGPRTLPQLQDVVVGADVRLDADVLDRIDEIVLPGLNVNPGDAGYEPQALTDVTARRRPA